MAVIRKAVCENDVSKTGDRGGAFGIFAEKYPGELSAGP